MAPQVNLSRYTNALSRKHQVIRFVWTVVWTVFARPVPRNLFPGWKRFLLRLFGAKIHPTSIVYSSAKIYYPPNLIMEEHACLASDTDCYNVDLIRIGAHTTISQGVFLCSAGHDITDPLNRLVTAPIIIEDQVWIAAGAFIGMGVTIGQGAVVGARGCVFRDVKPWTVVGGNPARIIKKRELKDSYA